MNAARSHGNVGIAHTRWATHGPPNEMQRAPAHRLHGHDRGRAQRHHRELRRAARRCSRSTGHKFESETDTEVLAHLIEAAFDGNLEDAVIDALALVEGTYGIAVISSEGSGQDRRARARAARCSSASATGEYYVASDVAAILAAHAPGRLSGRRRDGGADARRLPRCSTCDAQTRRRRASASIDWDLDQIEKGGFDHFMLKEIFEQPQTIENTMRGRLVADEGFSKLGGLNLTKEELLQFDHIVITACGTSWHSALIGELHDRGARAHSASRWSTRRSSATAIRSSTDKTLCVVDLAVGRDGGHARGDARGEAPRRARRSAS